MADTFAVVAAELQATGTGLRQVSEDASTDLARLSANVDSLLGGNWTGVAASAFRQGWTSWHRAATDAVGVLAEMGDLLVLSGRDYQRSDDAAAGGLASAGTGL